MYTQTAVHAAGPTLEHVMIWHICLCMYIYIYIVGPPPVMNHFASVTRPLSDIECICVKSFYA